MNEQTTMDLTYSHTVSPLRAKFDQFHIDNPFVYERLRTLALDLVDRGHRRIGIGMLFEVLRWQYAMTTTDTDFKLNNNYRAFYARALAVNEPRLADVFELRHQPTEGTHDTN